MQDKDGFIGEVSRIIKRGGNALLIVETTGVMQCMVRLIPCPCYERYFVNALGHAGIDKHFSLFYPIGMLLQYFDNEYRGKSFFIDRLMVSQL